jgi:hypothetical protein
MQVVLVEPPPPPEPVIVPAISRSAPEAAGRPPPRLHVRRVRMNAPVAPLRMASDDESPDVGLATDGDVAGAAAAGSGAGRGGGACDMAARLQAALRRDARAQAAASAAASAAGGRALLVWNGRWVRSRGQQGAGLAAVREAMLWEIGFSPAACRNETVSGMVLLSLDDRPGAARLVLGHGSWKWADLLKL